MKNATFFRRTIPICVSGSRILMTMVSTMMPMTSSIIAALIIVVPSSPLSLPRSLSACTVMDTLVAVIMTPMNTFLRNSSVPGSPKPWKSPESTKPPIRGTSTPQLAIRSALKPTFTSSRRFVPRPAENMRRMTPISAMSLMTSVCFTRPKMPGPIKRPASI